MKIYPDAGLAACSKVWATEQQLWDTGEFYTIIHTTDYYHSARRSHKSSLMSVKPRLDGIARDYDKLVSYLSVGIVKLILFFGWCIQEKRHARCINIMREAFLLLAFFCSQHKISLSAGWTFSNELTKGSWLRTKRNDIF
jgi:hypothetical protein